MSERVTTERVRELRDAATPGPWEHEHIGYGGQEITMDARHSVFVDGRGNAALIAAAPDLAADLLEAREELRLTTPAVDAVRGVIAALCLAPDATHTEVVAAVEERAGMLAHAVQSWKARASGMEAAEREVARLRSIVEGRTVPPTDAEIAAHHVTRNGQWLVRVQVSDCGGANADVLLSRGSARDARASGLVLRWWPLANDGRPCAWPAPREPAADVARDAPGVG